MQLSSKERAIIRLCLLATLGAGDAMSDGKTVVLEFDDETVEEISIEEIDRVLARFPKVD